MRGEQILAKIEASKDTIEFLPTGFERIDKVLDGGFMRKELVVLGGFTGWGKSYIATEIFYNLAKKGFKSIYFSLELSNEAIVSRIIGAITNLKPTRIIAGVLSMEELQTKIEGKAKFLVFNDYMEFYDDIYKLEEIEKRIKISSPEFAIIDFIQNVMARGEEYERLSYISLELQRIAKEANCCILLLSQLSNEAAKKGYVEYKGSGGIATVCDLGFFMKRSGENTSGVMVDNVEFDDAFELLLKKNRRGASGISFQMKFKKPGGRIKCE